MMLLMMLLLLLHHGAEGAGEAVIAECGQRGGVWRRREDVNWMQENQVEARELTLQTGRQLSKPYGKVVLMSCLPGPWLEVDVIAPREPWAPHGSHGSHGY